MADLTGLSACAPPCARAAALAARLQALHQQIGQAERRAGRVPGSVALLAVSKGFPPADVLALARAGQTRFGESYLSEATGKMDACADTALEWHYVGRLQRRKLAAIAKRFAWVHSLETLEQARALGRARPPGAVPLQVCIQVNVDAERSKAGIAPAEARRLARDVAGMSGLALRGLMALPAPPAGQAELRAPFRRLAELFDALRDDGHLLDTLSMGMSADFEDAIAERATLVRVGTALFGPRGGGHR
jgi:PLP dependent protein